ncbi:hypothetical protein HS048_35410 [Planomonospora sp. ID91781]|uniref:hypothetical protein n=1 Tax=Planomonospora sp. ID91781 TaxID=2738135 RepID=UPI0018C38CE7|nr:hypothetical protein [Planomonospora sp. ID91781]MBG0825961.1 hypothetical protein [Planomonospora sp. ID91781]
MAVRPDSPAADPHPCGPLPGRDGSSRPPPGSWYSLFDGATRTAASTPVPPTKVWRPATPV